jgi:hypothetical protein
MAHTLQESINTLGHHLKMKFKLPPDRPTAAEVKAIVAEVERLPEDQRTDSAWREIVYKHVNFVGIYKYEGIDYSDLNALQAQIIQLLG